jgi:hypothetical protein
LFCGMHSTNVIGILRNEFRFESVSWSAATGAISGNGDWDIVYGGYVHCGKSKGARPLDFDMATGLNKRLSDAGWSNLKPHQIWFPCMGCITPTVTKIASAGSNVKLTHPLVTFCPKTPIDLRQRWMMAMPSCGYLSTTATTSICMPAPELRTSTARRRSQICPMAQTHSDTMFLVFLV